MCLGLRGFGDFCVGLRVDSAAPSKVVVCG